MIERSSSRLREAGSSVVSIGRGVELGDDTLRFWNKISAMLRFGKGEGFRRKEDRLVMTASRTVTFRQAQAGIDRLRFTGDHAAKQLFPLSGLPPSMTGSLTRKVPLAERASR